MKGRKNKLLAILPRNRNKTFQLLTINNLYYKYLIKGYLAIFKSNFYIQKNCGQTSHALRNARNPD